VVTKKTRVAGEVVAFCRKCGLDLNHIVVAMVNGAPKKVLCLTCKTEHAYHRPLEERGVPAAPRAARIPGAPRTSAKAEAEAFAESAREKTWRERVSGKSAAAFATYSPRTSYVADQLLRHPKFGDGFVEQVIDAGKIEVMFRDGPRTLAHGLGGG
jgi:hypothetical protein